MFLVLSRREGGCFRKRGYVGIIRLEWRVFGAGIWFARWQA